MSITSKFINTALHTAIVTSAIATLALSTSAIAADIAVVDDSVAGDSEITLSVENFRETSGELKVALYGSEEGFKDGNVVRAASAEVDGTTVTFTFEGLAPGEYAIAMYHDANSDGEMNTNMFGIPTEQFGFSNDAMGRMGPPSWRAAKFTLESAATQTITLN